MPLLFVALSLCAQTQLTVAQLESFIESSIRLKHDDRQVAKYLERLKLAERLDARTIEDLQGLGAGPKTVQALRELSEQSKGLPAPAPKQTVEASKPTIPPPSAKEQSDLLAEVREYALNYTKTLPDFICTQVARRYYDPSGLEFWQKQDTLTVRLSYFEQKENYKLVMVNNQVTDLPYESVGGATSTGEFGSMLREIFEPSSNTMFQWERWATLRGRRAHVFSYRVSQANSHWRLSYERRDEIIAGYYGLVYVDKATGMVLRITLTADQIPPAFPIHEASTLLDYDFTKISGQEYLLPLRAVVRMRQAKALTKNEVEFRLYRKFAADAVITFDTPDPLPEDQTKEQPPQK